MNGGFDPQIVQDFLTESGELLEQLDRDLVLLERSAHDPDLLNQVFRALHTIKGSASFLALTNLVNLAHAAEGALNAARNGQFVVGRGEMDLLLAAVDTLRKQFADLAESRDLTEADAGLVARLTALGEGRGAAHAAPAHAAAPACEPPAAGAAEPGAGGRTEAPLNLPENKAALIEFLIPDLNETLKAAGEAAELLASEATRASAASRLAELGELMSKSGEFFEFEAMSRLAGLLVRVGEAAQGLEDAALAQAAARVRAALWLAREQSEGLERGVVVVRAAEGLCAAVEAIVEGGAAAAVPSGCDAETALRADGVLPPVAATAASAERSAPAPLATATEAGGEHDEVAQKAGAAHAAGPADSTIRVEVSRLESLLNLVGELVLQKNRLAAIARQAAGTAAGTQDFRDSFTQATGTLDRVTSDIQVAVMRTRMQPLDKLFGRYPRLIRDLARKTGKEMKLAIEGGDTEVDKSVIEELGDPLVHLLRNSADHGLETAEDRVRAGKPGEGTITIGASHEGSHVRVTIRDDGRGLSRKRIGAKAVERGLVTEAELAQMSDRDVNRFIFAAGFSTADKVTDLSGRGVGMDVVRTNIEKIKGTIDLETVEGRGTTVVIKIPLTVAILTAMMVGIGPEKYAVPLHNILEIVKPEPKDLYTIHGAPVMRLRDGVLPLLDGCEVFGLPEAKRERTPFAVVVALSDKRVGLMVSRLIGQQEVVIKPLDETVERIGPVSGATVRDDGGVSLIVDVAQMIAMGEARAATKGRASRGAAPAGTGAAALAA